MTQHVRKNLSRALGSTALVLLVLSGCAGVDDAGTDATEPGATATENDELRPWYRRGGARPLARTRDGAGGRAGTTAPPTSHGGTSNGAPTGAAACAVCATANACCNTVGGGALCTFSATTCAGLPESSQAPYINACKTLLNTVASVRSVLPDSCR